MLSSRRILPILFGMLFSVQTVADEALWGVLKGTETLPAGSLEFDQTINYRTGKSVGDYDAFNLKTEIEYGLTNRLTTSAYLKTQSIDTQGILIEGYLPRDEDYFLRPSGIEATLKYNFLSPAKDDIGLSMYASLSYDWLDPHSGQDKDVYAFENQLLLQKYFMEGQLIWAGNLRLKVAHATRGEIEGLAVDFDWPTHPEMEIELGLATGLSYRFTQNWFLGFELLYESEHETEVGQERYSWFLGPGLHYGGRRFWATFAWLYQIDGGGETFPGQTDQGIHLIEKTEQEFVLKFGIDF